MYQNYISTASIGGHGLGGKAALLSSIYKPINITSYIGINYSPVNYNYYEFGKRFKIILNELND